MTTTKTIGYATETSTLRRDQLRGLPVHRTAGLFRPFDNDERDRLRSSMQARFDESHPIVVWKKTNEIVDGRNRRDLALELELATVPVAYVDFPNDEEVTRFVVQQNLARRHLTPAERADMAAELVVKNGTSVREAAETTSVSKSAVQRAAAKTRARVPRGTPAGKRTTGKDGKSYPSTRKDPNPKSTPKPESATERALDEIKSVGEYIPTIHDALRAAVVGRTIKGKGADGKVRRLKVAAVRFDKDGRAYVTGSRSDGNQSRTLFIDAITEVVQLADRESDTKSP